MKSVEHVIVATNKRHHSAIGWRRIQTSGLAIVLLQWALCSSITMTTTVAATVLASTLDEMSPPRIEIAIGDSANITCRSAVSSSIWFFEVNSQRSIAQPSRDIVVLDRHTVVLMLRNAAEQISVYRCMSGDEAIGETKVYVGTPPLNVIDFKCLGFDYINMTCTFQRPANAIYTHYKVKYTIDNSIAEYTYDCTVEENDKYMSFTMSSPGDNCTYLPLREMYKFNLTGQNALGSNTQVFDVDNLRSVVPAKLNVHQHHITTDSITLKWKNGQFAYYERQGLLYDITITPKGFNLYKVSLADNENCNSNNCSLTLRKLPYPNWEYSLRMRVRVRSSSNREDMWSEAYEGTFVTKSRRPDHPPETSVGSFYIDPSETQLRLYWQSLMPFEENGANFHYIVNETDLDGNVLNSMQTTETSIAFPSQRAERFYYIKAANELGDSVDSSIIRVYPLRRDAAAYIPSTIARLYHNRTYTLSWKAPKLLHKLSNYTIFWCMAKLESTTQCKGTIHSKYVDTTKTNFTTDPQDHTLILAVSANYLGYSTGMHWAMCSASVSSDLMKMEPEAVAVSATEIRIHWSLEHMCTSVLKGYNITYCLVAKAGTIGEDVECISEVHTFTLLRSKKEYKDYIISGLKPYSMYRIDMLMYSQSKVGPMSNPLYIRTNESAPTPPRNVSVNMATVTSNSAEISWYAPSIMNGHLQNYTIWWRTKNNTDHKTLSLGELNITEEFSGPITYKLQSLSSYSNYTVFVTAETVESSEPSMTVHFLTSIGRPSNPRYIKIIPDGDNRILEWQDPEVPSGRVEIYEILMVTIFKNNRKSEEKKTYIIGGLSQNNHRCRFSPPECTATTEMIEMHVRAVNVADKYEIDNSTFLVAKAAKKRRHTNPEISSSALNIQTYDEGIVRMGKSFNKTVVPSVDVGGNYIEVYDVPESDFECTPIDEKNALNVQSSIFNKGKRGEKFRLESEWEKSPDRYLCATFSWDSALGLAIIVLFAMAIISFITYMGHKKLSKMKNIEAILPEGLVDHMAVSSKFGNGYENSLEKELSDISNSFAFLNLPPKEDCHLLNSGNGLNSLTPSSADSGSGDGGNDNKELLEQCQHEEQSSESTDTLEIRDVSTSSCHESPLRSELALKEVSVPVPARVPKLTEACYEESPYLLLSSMSTAAADENELMDNPSDVVNSGVGGYVTPSTLLLARNATLDNTPKAFQAAPSGYVQANSVMMLGVPPSVAPPEQQQIASTDGYVTPDAIGKAMLTAPSAVGNALDAAVWPNAAEHKLQNALNTENSLSREFRNSTPNQGINNNNNNNNSICGYVTQRQLAEFGQLIH